MVEKVYISKELLEYKRKLKAAIVRNKNIIELINLNSENKMTQAEILKKRILPRQYKDEVIDDAYPYIMYDVDIAKVNKTFKKVTVNIWVGCPNIHYYSDNGDCIPDLISLEIENTLLDKEFQSDLTKQFGLGLECVCNEPYPPTYKNMGRILTFECEEWTNGKKNGR